MQQEFKKYQHAISCCSLVNTERFVDGLKHHEDFQGMEWLKMEVTKSHDIRNFHLLVGHHFPVYLPDACLFLCISFFCVDSLPLAWLLPQGVLLEANKSAGLLISDNSLVLQKVQRGSAGVYMCAAHNREGKGVSNNVKLNVMCKYSCDSSAKNNYNLSRLWSQFGRCLHGEFRP